MPKHRSAEFIRNQIKKLVLNDYKMYYLIAKS